MLGTTSVDPTLKRAYLTFLDDRDRDGYFYKAINKMIVENQNRILIDINHIRRELPMRINGLLNDSLMEMSSFQAALMDAVMAIDPVYAKECQQFLIGLEGSFGNHHVTPRTLSAEKLGRMVCLEGLVTKCTLVHQKTVKTVHFCPATGKTIERLHLGGIYPTKDDDGNVLETEFGLSVYNDCQTFTMQEIPEKTPVGQLPRSVDVSVENDLVDVAKPGDRLQVVGIYSSLASKRNSYTSATFRTILLANHIQAINTGQVSNFSSDDVLRIKKFSRRRNINVFDHLANSLAPSIHGHPFVKKALLCQFLGGNEKILENGLRIRGDVNVLLIGDPSVAKSQFLRYVKRVGLRTVATTGRGSSGVGLTAAVTTDTETGERCLEAGAMVLGDRGIVCIDEFDKMSDIDRTAIHEVMEQGRVTITKAGIHATLNARCAVLAAANPIYGRYNPYKTPMDNIAMQDSLLSRFDLVFIMLDCFDVEGDRALAQHVLEVHRFRPPGESDGQVTVVNDQCDLLHTWRPEDAQEQFSAGTESDLLDNDFLSKYIKLAKTVQPVLSQDACDCIANEYSKLRDQDIITKDNTAKTQPVTVRTLETMIRLATAHAKARLSKKVTYSDALSAVELIEFAYFKKVLKRAPKKRIPEEAEEEEVVSEDDEVPQPAHKIVRVDEDMEIDEDRMKLFRQHLLEAFRSTSSSSIDLENFRAQMGTLSFSPGEINHGLSSLVDSNKIMIADGFVFLI